MQYLREIAITKYLFFINEHALVAWLSGYNLRWKPMWIELLGLNNQLSFSHILILVQNINMLQIIFSKYGSFKETYHESTLN